MIKTLTDSLYGLIDVLENHITEILLGAVIFAVFFVISKKLEKLAVNLLSKMFHDREDIRQGIESALIGPCNVFFRLIGAYLGLHVIPFPAGTAHFIYTVFRIVTIIIIAWALSGFMPFATSLIIKSNKKSNKKTNEAAIKFLSNIFRCIIFSIAGVVVISELGYNINGIITGIGLGGLTFSLAAQKTATNLFGGLAIVTDKPFDVGDRITTPSVDGVVEDITMRSTRIRTFANTVMIVPNSTLIEEPITNWSRMKKRITDFKIGLTYDTSVETIKKISKRIEKMLRSHKNIDQSQITVYFDEFSDSSLDIRIIYFTKTTDYYEWIKIKDEVNLKIKEIVESENASFAFPSASVYMEKTV